MTNPRYQLKDELRMMMENTRMLNVALYDSKWTSVSETQLPRGFVNPDQTDDGDKINRAITYFKISC